MRKPHLSIACVGVGMPDKERQPPGNIPCMRGMQNPCAVHPAPGHLPDSVLLAKQALEYLNLMRLPCMAGELVGHTIPTAFRRLSPPVLMQSGGREIGSAEVQNGLNLQALKMICSRLLAHCWFGSCTREFL